MTKSIRLTFPLLALLLAHPLQADVVQTLQSSMIWSPAAPTGTQAYVAFRKEFNLAAVPADPAMLHLFADSRYLLWVNGRQILRGPSRFNPKGPEYDSLDIKPYLQTGANSLVVLVHHYAGATSGRIMSHAPGLTALLEAGGQQILRSDTSWKSSNSTEYRPSPDAWSSIPDVIDARLSPGTWTTTDFDDSAWAAAAPVDGNTWGALQARHTPLAKETELAGVKRLPGGEAVSSLLPIDLVPTSAPMTYAGGYSGHWMWSPAAAPSVWFKTVWSNAKFGSGAGCSIKVFCDNSFTLYVNGIYVGQSSDWQTGHTGNLNLNDGDVITIDAQDLENGDHTAGLFAAIVRDGSTVLTTSDFLCTTTAPAAGWRTNVDLTGFGAPSSANVHPAHKNSAASASIILDLGKMAMAYPKIQLDADAGSTLQIQYALRYVNGQPQEMYGTGTTFTARAGPQELLAADQWCARYVTLTCTSGRVRILGLQMIDRRYPYERVGSFQCSDPMLTNLWEMAVNTIEATTDDAHGTDARERNEWVQDCSKASFNTIRVAAAGPDGNGGRIYSDPRTLRKLLRDSAHSQLPDGRMLGTFPTDRGDSDPHYVIEDYALQWVEALRWYHDLSGDTAFVQEMWPTLVAQMQWCLDRITARGLLNAREYTSFDNPLAYITCEGANINAFFYQSLRDAAYLAGVASQTTQGNAYTAAADALHSAYNTQLWNATEQAYSAGFYSGSKLGPTVHAQLLALYSGLVPADRLAATRAWFVANYKNPGAELAIGPKSNYLTLIANKAGLGMPIMYYWAFNELYRADTAAMDQEAISEMRCRWTNMVNFLQDAGTLSESFVNEQGGGMSESCHNYGAVPAWFLSSFVLGPRVSGPHGNRQLVIEPRPGDLTSASGTVVTDLGPVPVSWTKNNGTLQFSCTVPPGKTATLRVPVVGSAITLDGNVVNNPLIEGRHVVLPLSAGVHALTAEPPPITTRTIYEDTLIDNNVPLNGTFPTTSSNFAGGSASAAWAAAATITQSASGTTYPASAAAFLPVSIQPGYIYQLSATLSAASTWTAIGFSDSSASGQWHTTPNKYAWALVRATGAGAPQFFGGAGAANLQSWSSSADGTRTVSITLDTTGAQWTAFASIDGVNSSTFTFTANPSISHVGFGGDSNGSSVVRDFRLTATGTPPPYIRTDDQITGRTTVEVPGSGALFQENLAGRTDFLKTGTGMLMLSDPAQYSGASRILTGALKLSPATNILPPATSLSLEDSTSVLDLNGATQTVASLASVAGSVVQLNGGSLIISGNSGDAVVQGTITGSGNLTNTGTLRLTGNAVFDLTGTFTNTGVLDLMTWNGTLPAGFVNHGIVLDRSAVKIETFALSGNDFTLTIQGHAGHNYQLQRSTSLLNDWQNLGSSQPGNNVPLVFTDSGGASADRRFYRISVVP